LSFFTQAWGTYARGLQCCSSIDQSIEGMTTKAWKEKERREKQKFYVVDSFLGHALHENLLDVGTRTSKELHTQTSHLFSLSRGGKTLIEKERRENDHS